MAAGAKIEGMDKKKSSNKSFKEERSPEEQAMMDRVDEYDKKIEEGIEE